MLRTLVLLFVLIITAACNLNAVEKSPPTAAVVAPTAAVQPTPTPTLQPTLQPTQSSSGALVNVSGNICTPRTDWPLIYTVVSGDTLASLAQRTGSTVEALAAGNCLPDENTILVGQQLRVPRAPTAQLPPTIMPNPGVSLNASYTNPTLGIAFDYPAGWAVQETAYYVEFVGPNGSSLEIIYGPEGQITPPIQAAADCKSVLACIGSRTVTFEQGVTLPSGFNGYRMDLSVDPVSGSGPFAVLFTVIKNRNLGIRGFGDLNLYTQMLNSLRPA